MYRPAGATPPRLRVAALTARVARGVRRLTPTARSAAIALANRAFAQCSRPGQCSVKRRPTTGLVCRYGYLMQAWPLSPTCVALAHPPLISRCAVCTIDLRSTHAKGVRRMFERPSTWPMLGRDLEERPAKCGAVDAVLITGCSSGIGRATAERWRHAAAQGVRDRAQARRLAGLAERGCRTLSLDVTDEQSMRSAVAAVEERKAPSECSSTTPGTASRARSRCSTSTTCVGSSRRTCSG